MENVADNRCRSYCGSPLRPGQQARPRWRHHQAICPASFPCPGDSCGYPWSYRHGIHRTLPECIISKQLCPTIDTNVLLRPSVYAHIVNFYLAPLPPSKYSDDRDEYKIQQAIYEEKSILQEKIIALATNYSAESQSLLQGYAREALRL